MLAPIILERKKKKKNWRKYEFVCSDSDMHSICFTSAQLRNTILHITVYEEVIGGRVYAFTDSTFGTCESVYCVFFPIEPNYSESKF